MNHEDTPPTVSSLCIEQNHETVL